MFRYAAKHKKRPVYQNRAALSTSYLHRLRAVEPAPNRYTVCLYVLIHLRQLCRLVGRNQAV